MTIAADRRFEDIKVGDRASFRHTISDQDVSAFAALSGDFNPLHTDREYASTTQFGRRIVHGMLLASLFSRLLGMHLPGRRCLFMSQSLDFVQPVYVGEELQVCGQVLRTQDATRTLVIQTTIRALPDRLVVRGKAHVKVLE